MTTLFYHLHPVHKYAEPQILEKSNTLLSTLPDSDSMLEKNCFESFIKTWKIKNSWFVISCGHATLQEGLSVGPSVRPSARVEKWENAHIRPYPPVRNWWPCIRLHLPRPSERLGDHLLPSNGVTGYSTKCTSGHWEGLTWV